jgi:hypothetical protein
MPAAIALPVGLEFISFPNRARTAVGRASLWKRPELFKEIALGVTLAAFRAEPPQCQTSRQVSIGSTLRISGARHGFASRARASTV